MVEDHPDGMTTAPARGSYSRLHRGRSERSATIETEMWMRRVREAMAVGAMAAALVLPLAACSSDAKTSSAGTTTTTAASNKNFEVTTADGQISLSLDGKLPPGWPSSFPVPDGATAAGSGSLANSSKGKLVAVFTTSGSAEDTYNFYKGSSALTVDSSSAIGAGPAYVGTVAFSGSFSGRVSVISRGSQTTIVVALDATSTNGSTDAGGATATTGGY